LKLKTELFPESKGPFQGLLNDVERNMRAEDFQKIIKVVANVSGEMELKDPVKSFCKEVKDVGRRATAEAENYVVVKQVLPGETEEMPVSVADRDMTERGLEVEFYHE
jgi:hypothetical protein